MSDNWQLGEGEFDELERRATVYGVDKDGPSKQLIAKAAEIFRAA